MSSPAAKSPISLMRTKSSPFGYAMEPSICELEITPKPVPVDQIRVEPTQAFLASGPRVANREEYDRMYQQSVDEPEEFWGKEASDLHWYKQWDSVKASPGPNFSHDKWFDGAKTNLCYNSIDRHVAAGLGDKVAIHFVTETQGTHAWTYQMLKDETSRLANALESLGVGQGDRVLIYMPLSPENVIAMQACARIGAIHSVVFGGFSSHQILVRLQEAKPKVILTADGSIRRGKPVNLKSVVDQALSEYDVCNAATVSTISLNRSTGAEFDMGQNDHDWKEFVGGQSDEHAPAELDAHAPAFVLYTSGSTGVPKGVVHSVAGYMVGVNTTMKYIMDAKQSDVFWCTADMGWITGHSYVTYGPLLSGCSQVMFEGSFDLSSWGKLFEIIEEFKVTTLYTAPTLIRALIAQKVDPEAFNLDSLRLLGSVGEPINTEGWNWYFHKVGGGRCPIVDTWWQTETGSHMISNTPGAVPSVAGKATLPCFGVKPVIVDEEGKEVGPGVKGRLFISQSWPSMLTGMLGKPHSEFESKYFPEFGMYVAGDAAMKDDEGFIKILGRSDDQLNVSGHRIGTAEIESVIQSHPDVTKAAVIPRPDALTGQAIAAVLVLNTGVKTGQNGDVKQYINAHIAQEYGPFGKAKYIYVVETLPETKSGKTMRGLIREIMDAIDAQGEMEEVLAALDTKYSTMDRSAAGAENLIQDLGKMLRA